MRYIEVIDEFYLKDMEERYRTSKRPIVRKHLQALILSANHKSMKEISEELNMSRTTLYRLFNAWDKASYDEKVDVIFVKKGRGAKPKLNSVKEILPSLVEKYNKNIKKILQALEDDYNIQVCNQTLRKYLKKL